MGNVLDVIVQGPIERCPVPGPREIHAHVTRPVVTELARVGARSVLDLGCGDGWFTGALDLCGFEATGIDRDAGRLDSARLHLPHLRFAQVDAMLELDAALAGRFDAVVAIDVLDHVPNPARLIRTALQALRPGGRLILTLPYHGYVKNLGLALLGRFDRRWAPHDEDGRLKFFSHPTLEALLSPFGLTDVRMETVGRVAPIARAMMITAAVPH